MANRPHILVVDDEPQITRVLRTTLNAQGYEIRVANDGETALEIVKDFTPDLVITDLMMPNMNGMELCRQLRKTSQVPILVLSVRGEERSKIEALDSGADDYITKPFSTGELLARVRAALRRAPPGASEPKSKIEAGDFRIDVDAHSVFVANREVRLTPKEFDVLLYMAQRPHKVLTHRAILNAVWGANSMEQNEYLRVFVGQLRKKLEPDASSPKYILTEPWVGYRFEPGD
jgi:two-component system, OmpR family, KDP operon response regulator KdpE